MYIDVYIPRDVVCALTTYDTIRCILYTTLLPKCPSPSAYGQAN